MYFLGNFKLQKHYALKSSYILRRVLLTFGLWSRLEVTDLIENLFLLYSRRIICAENESLQDYEAPVSISPMLQRLSLSSVL